MTKTDNSTSSNNYMYCVIGKILYMSYIKDPTKILCLLKINNNYHIVNSRGMVISGGESKD